MLLASHPAPDPRFQPSPPSSSSSSLSSTSTLSNYPLFMPIIYLGPEREYYGRVGIITAHNNTSSSVPTISLELQTTTKPVPDFGNISSLPLTYCELIFLLICTLFL